MRHEIKQIDPERVTRRVLIDAYKKLRETYHSYRCGIRKMKRKRKGLKDQFRTRAYRHYRFIYERRFAKFRQEMRLKAKKQVARRVKQKMATARRRVFNLRPQGKYKEIGIFGILLFILARRLKIRGELLCFFIWAGEYEMFQYSVFISHLKQYGNLRFRKYTNYFIDIGLIQRVNGTGRQKVYALTGEGRILHDKITRYLKNHTIDKVVETKKKIVIRSRNANN